MSPEQLAVLRQELSECKAVVEKHQETIHNLNRDKEGLATKSSELERRLMTLESEYEELLDKTIADEEHDANIEDTIAELKVSTKLVFYYIDQLDDTDPFI